MQVIRNKSTQVAVYLLADTEAVTLSAAGLKAGNLHALDITDAQHEAIAGVPAPDVWAGNALTWDGAQWAVVDQAAVDAAQAALEAAAQAEQLAAREAAKAARASAVEAITVTTAAGNTFDGDETSQARMSRAILVLSTGAAASVPWVLADNTVIQASAAELTEALALAGAEQARLWVLP